MVIMARGARLGFLIPPGNPTVEPEMMAMTPKGVSVHFSRMVAHGPTGTLDGQDERNRTQIAHIGESAELLAMVKPDVIMLAHTATSYTLGRQAEAQLLERLRDQCGTPVATAFGSVDQLAPIFDRGCQRLLHQHVLAGFERGHRDGQVGGGRGGDGGGVHGRVVERAGHPHRRVAAEDPMRAFGIQVAEVFQAEPGSRLRIADQVGPQ